MVQKGQAPVDWLVALRTTNRPAKSRLKDAPECRDTLLVETEPFRSASRVVELIRRHGGSISTRELQRSARYPAAADAEATLQTLADAEIGSWDGWKTGPQAGRPTRAFRLSV